MNFLNAIGLDWYYLVLVVPALILSLIASSMVKSRFAEYDKIPSKKGISGAQAAKILMQENDISDVQINRISGSLTDNYSSTDKTLNLSESTYSSTSIAAIGVAAHETGHAILFHVLPGVGPVHTVSIIPTGRGAAGYTMPLPEKDEMYETKGRMFQEIVVSLGGRAAEELVIGDVTTGASEDIRQATRTARAMVTKYGFSEKLGLINYEQDDNEIFIGRDLGHTREYSERIASLIDEEVQKLIDAAYEKAKEIISGHRDVLDRSAALLMEKEKLSRAEFEALFN